MLLLGLAGHPVNAQEESEPSRERAAAEALFKAGHSAMDRGDYDLACQKFQASMELDPAPGTLMNLGNCEERRGNVASAWERYIAAQRDLPETDRRRQFAREKVAELEPKVPRLRLVLAEDAPESTEIRREEVDLTGSLGVALPLDPGSYSIRVTAPGYREQTFEVELALGESREMEVGPGERLPEPDPVVVGAEPPQRFGPLTQREWGYVAGGVGAVGVGAALTFGALALGEKSTMEEHCDASRCDPVGSEAKESGGTYATLANVAGGVGLAALGAGVFLVLTSPENDEGAVVKRSPNRSAGTFSARLEWVGLPGGQTLRLRGEFW